MSLHHRLAALAFLVFCAPSAAFFVPTGAPPADTVVEYFNTGTGHYFYTWSPGDQSALASGAFGAGWVQTGLGFGAYGTRDRGSSASYPLDACWAQGACLPIVRFYAPGPNSHFFTGSASDVDILDRPGTGWLRENIAFYTAMPDASGACAPDKAPVHRLYNNRAALNDTNHRYTADDVVRQLMVTRGWADEGVAFCAYGKRSVAKTYRFSVAQAADIMAMDDCRSRASSESCLGVLGLPIPSHAFASMSAGAPTPDEFDRKTGMTSFVFPLNVAVDGTSRAAAAEDAFVQVNPGITGIHLATRSRVGGPYANITALHRLTPGAVRPYRFDTGNERELYLRSILRVQQLSAGPDSHAYGVFTWQFRDETSGRALLFNVIGFGTLPAGEGVGRDLHTSLPLVYATFGTDGRFGELSGGVASEASSALTGFFEARIGSRHLQAILDAARQVDPLLSPRPEDYSLANFGLVNEAYGEGEMGLVVHELSLSVQGAQ